MSNNRIDSSVSSKLAYKGPVVLAIMDGVGLKNTAIGNAFAQAKTDFLDYCMQKYPWLALDAAGEAVGVLPGDMGNSEVGHNTLGTGQIVKQGAARIDEAFKTGEIWQSPAWRGAIDDVKKNGSTLHFAGIFSDGHVHSSFDHLEQMITHAHDEGVKHIRVHAVIDGRDVPPESEPKYIDRFESFVKSFPDNPDYEIASGGGRMIFVADRYESNWETVKAGWDAMVLGKAPYYFPSAREAISSFREAGHKQDQYIPPFVIRENGHPVGQVKDGDSFIYFDFRADRAIEIAQAFTYNDFPYFDRGTEGNRRLNVYFAGMTEYNSDTHVPEHQLVQPVEFHDPLNTFLGEHGISQLAVAETVKFGHVTYYFNGNSYDKASGEEHLEIKSYTEPLNTRPWLKSAETTDLVLENLEKYRFVRVNYPGGDMVGHFGEMQSGVVAMEAIDLQLRRLAEKVDELGGCMLITADHGNIEEVTTLDGKPKTSHTLNPVPFIFYDNTENAKRYRLLNLPDAGLANVAATVATMLGQSGFPASWHKPLIELT